MADKQTTANDVSADEELKAVANDHDFWQTGASLSSSP